MRTFPTKWSTNQYDFFQTQAIEKTQGLRTMRSAMLKNALAPMASVSNRIVRRTGDPLSYTAYGQAGQTVQEPVATLDAALDLDNGGPPSLPAQQLATALATDLSESNLLASPQICNMMAQMDREEAERIPVSRVDPFLYKDGENTLSDASQAGSNATNDGLRISLYHFVM